MDKYNIKLANQVYISLWQIVENKKLYDYSSAVDFAEQFFLDIEKLAIFPNRGFNLIDNFKARIYKNHLIIYEVLKNEVRVIDIVDPRQYTNTLKYYS